MLCVCVWERERESLLRGKSETKNDGQSYPPGCKSYCLFIFVFFRSTYCCTWIGIAPPWKRYIVIANGRHYVDITFRIRCAINGCWNEYSLPVMTISISISASAFATTTTTINFDEQINCSLSLTLSRTVESSCYRWFERQHTIFISIRRNDCSERIRTLVLE